MIHRRLIPRAGQRPTFLAALICGALLADLAGQPGRADAVKPGTPPDLAEVRPGMAPKDVLQRRGKPKHIARQILYRRYLEQWVYDEPNAIRIEFNCVRGREPQILTVQPLTIARP